MQSATAIRFARRICVGLAILCALAGIGLNFGFSTWAKVVYDGQVLVITSGSMEPTIDSGDLVVIQTIPRENLTVGQIITVRRANGELITHRVEKLDRNGTFINIITKGDANPDPDPDVVSAEDEVLGAVRTTIPHFGQVVLWAESLPGRLVLILPIFVFVALPELLRTLAARGQRTTPARPVVPKPAPASERHES